MSSKERELEKEFMALLAAHKGVVSKVCYMYAKDPEHFKDLYQETLVNIWQSMDRFRGDSAVSTWVYRIAINSCVTMFRRYRKHNDNVSLDNEAMFALADTATDDHEHAECLREMYALIGQLPPVDKAIVLMWLDEKSYDEIAKVTGLSRSNVATRLHRCRQKLSEMSDH